MNKVALVIPNNLWLCPYVSSYTKVLDHKSIPYDIISWNRASVEESCIQYNRPERSRNLILVLFSYIRFARFVKKIILEHQYEKAVIFSPQLSIFLAKFLRSHLNGKYIVDYRDLSIEQIGIFKRLFTIALSNSYANVISSPGFKAYLPPEFNYMVSHNFILDQASLDAIDKPLKPNCTEVKVLTIGAIREDRNKEVIDALGNKNRIRLSFVGKGPATQMLESYVKEQGYENISFTGFYKKLEEPDLIRDSSMINIVYPLIPSHISALSNRFYNSLIYKRPMIVTKNTIQGDFAEEYGVGLVVENCENLSEKIHHYLDNLLFDDYCHRCDMLLRQFVGDNKVFSTMLSDFC